VLRLLTDTRDAKGEDVGVSSADGSATRGSCGPEHDAIVAWLARADVGVALLRMADMFRRLVPRVNPGIFLRNQISTESKTGTAPLYTEPGQGQSGSGAGAGTSADASASVGGNVSTNLLGGV